MIAYYFFYVSRRQLDGLVGHDGHAEVGFVLQPVDRCIAVVFCVILHYVL